ncbi:MAG: phosphoribulokinase [Actinomycetota bacterium]
MSRKHPIIAVTGSSGAGTSTVKEAFEHMFRREGIKPAIVEGDSYHRFNRAEMKKAMAEAEKAGNRNFSHFGADANLFHEIEELFARYGETGRGRRRFYIHNDEEAQRFAHYGVKSGEFTPWEDLPGDTDCLFYEGLHGAVVNKDVDVARHADLKIGVVPVINLEWIQKIHRDTKHRGYSEEAVMDTILRRMHDYVHYIVPQFKATDINFQRVPIVDTSDPIIARDIPTPDESLVVIRFRKPDRFRVDFPFLLQMLKDSWMSRRNTIVVPGGKMGLAMELILTPILRRIMEDRRSVLG